MSWYFLSAFTSSAAMPITPSIPLEFTFSIFFPWTDEIGKKLALPKLFLRKCSINFFASVSVFVTIFCIAWPKHISIAVSYFLSTEIRLASTPSTPAFNSLFCSHASSKDLTLFIYPSLSRSVSIKNLHLESFILYSAVSLFIFSSKSFITAKASSFWAFISVRVLTALFLVFSISWKFFEISCFFILLLSNSEIVLWSSCFTFFLVFSKFS